MREGKVVTLPSEPNSSAQLFGCPIFFIDFCHLGDFWRFQDILFVFFGTSLDDYPLYAVASPSVTSSVHSYVCRSDMILLCDFVAIHNFLISGARLKLPIKAMSSHSARLYQTQMLQIPGKRWVASPSLPRLRILTFFYGTRINLFLTSQHLMSHNSRLWRTLPIKAFLSQYQISAFRANHMTYVTLT